MIEPQLIRYHSTDGYRIAAWLYKPKNLKRGQRAPIVVAHERGEHERRRRQCGQRVRKDDVAGEREQHQRHERADEPEPDELVVRSPALTDAHARQEQVARTSALGGRHGYT